MPEDEPWWAVSLEGDEGTNAAPGQASVAWDQNVALRARLTRAEATIESLRVEQLTQTADVSKEELNRLDTLDHDALVTRCKELLESELLSKQKLASLSSLATERDMLHEQVAVLTTRTDELVEELAARDERDKVRDLAGSHFSSSQEVRALREERDMLTAKCKHITEVNAQLKDDITALQSHIKALETDAESQLRMRIEQLEQEVQETKTKYMNLMHIHADESEALLNEITAVTGERDVLRQKLKSMPRGPASPSATDRMGPLKEQDAIRENERLVAERAEMDRRIVMLENEKAQRERLEVDTDPTSREAALRKALGTTEVELGVARAQAEEYRTELVRMGKNPVVRSPTHTPRSARRFEGALVDCNVTVDKMPNVSATPPRSESSSPIPRAVLPEPDKDDGARARSAHARARRWPYDRTSREGTDALLERSSVMSNASTSPGYRAQSASPHLASSPHYGAWSYRSSESSQSSKRKKGRRRKHYIDAPTSLSREGCWAYVDPVTIGMSEADAYAYKKKTARERGEYLRKKNNVHALGHSEVEATTNAPRMGWGENIRQQGHVDFAHGRTLD